MCQLQYDILNYPETAVIVGHADTAFFDSNLESVMRSSFTNWRIMSPALQAILLKTNPKCLRFSSPKEIETVRAVLRLSSNGNC
jgi:hypothetical protein